MKRYIDLDLEKCSACGACAVACMDQNDIDIQTENLLGMCLWRIRMGSMARSQSMPPLPVCIAAMRPASYPVLWDACQRMGTRVLPFMTTPTALAATAAPWPVPLGSHPLTGWGKCRNVTAVLNGSFMEWSRPVQGSVPPERSNAIQRKNTKLPG